MWQHRCPFAPARYQTRPNPVSHVTDYGWSNAKTDVCFVLEAIVTSWTCVHCVHRVGVACTLTTGGRKQVQKIEKAIIGKKPFLIRFCREEVVIMPVADLPTLYVRDLKALAATKLIIGAVGWNPDADAQSLNDLSEYENLSVVRLADQLWPKAVTRLP